MRIPSWYHDTKEDGILLTLEAAKRHALEQAAAATVRSSARRTLGKGETAENSRQDKGILQEGYSIGEGRHVHIPLRHTRHTIAADT